MKLMALLFSGIFLFLAGCGGGGVSASATLDVPIGGSDRSISQEEQTLYVGEAGTVHYIDLEGGFFAIVGDSGQQYDPMNLPSEFAKDGLRVRFEGSVRTDLMSTHMYGTTIEITKIEKL